MLRNLSTAEKAQKLISYAKLVEFHLEYLKEAQDKELFLGTLTTLDDICQLATKIKEDLQGGIYA